MRGAATCKLALKLTYSPQKPEKLCVFCGSKPDGKSKEHVLPQWLIRRTGNPKRRVILGSQQKNGHHHLRVFAFDQFTFPACQKCNSEYSELEAQAAVIVEVLLQGRAVSEADCDVFLDWLDKVRVGVWLGNRHLTGNQADVDPNFHIAARIGTADRMAWIMRADNLQNGLSVVGTQTPMFAFMPSAFGIRVNQLLILSASTDLMISRALGLPHPARRWVELGERRAMMTLAPGTGRIGGPLIDVEPRLAALRLYQPIFGRFRDGSPELFAGNHSHAVALDWAKGRGRVFVDGFEGLRPGGVGELDYLLTKGFAAEDRVGEFGASVLEVQNALARRNASLTRLPPQIRRAEARRWRWAYAMNQRFIQAHLEGRRINSMAEVEAINAGAMRGHPT